MLKRPVHFALGLFLLLLPLKAVGEELPKLMEAYPKTPFESQGPVGADAKEVSQARSQLQREAAKLDADAVVGVRCKSGGIERQGLGFSKVRAYCKGIAVKIPNP